MQNQNVSSPRTALLLATVCGLGFALAGCTSVELAEDSRTPVISSTDLATNKVAEQSETEAQTKELASADGQAAANSLAAESDNAGSAATALAPPKAATTSASDAIAAAADTQPLINGEAKTSAHPSFAESKLVTAAFPPRPGAPGTPSAAEVPLTLEMMQAQSVVPMQKPRIPELAYAAAPQNAALAAIAEDEANMANPAGPLLRGKSQLNSLIQKYAKLYEVPESLVHRVVHRESRYNPGAYNSGNYGLMQIRLGTAKGLGFQGTTKDLFDAETNLKYAVKYLRGALLVADNNHDQAVRLYARGYYYDAKRKGMLHVLK